MKRYITFYNRTIYIIIFLIGFLSLNLFFKDIVNGAEIVITYQVDRDKVTLSDILNLKIVVQGVQNSPRPTLPDIPFFDLQYKGTSSQYKIINGKISAHVMFNYLLIPKKVGEFYLPPAEVKYRGKVYKSNSLLIKVSPSTQKVYEERDIFVTATVNRKDPYCGEQIIYTFRFYRKRNLAISGAQLKNVNFNGFRAHSLGKEIEYITKIKNKEFFVTELKWALFPVKSGAIQIPSTVLYCDVVYRRSSRGFFDDSFFGLRKTERKTVNTGPIDIQVKPLPSSLMPKDFSNLIGDFKLKSSIGKNEINLGDSCTLTLEISGRGNIKDIVEPNFPSLKEVKVYSDKPEFTVNKDKKGIYGKVIIKKALVPLKEGNSKIPSIQVTYFDPKERVFKNLKSKDFNLKVNPGEEKEELVLFKPKKSSIINNKEEIKILGRDILPIHTSKEVLINENLFISYKIFILLTCLPFFVFLFCFGVKFHKTRFLDNQVFKRKKMALKEFKLHIAPLRKEVKNEDSKLFYQRLLKALKDYLGHKMNLFGSALTTNEIEKYLTQNAVFPSLINDVKNILEEIELGYYASSGHSKAEREELLTKTKKLVKTLEKSIR
jgi:hypothetical protein